MQKTPITIKTEKRGAEFVVVMTIDGVPLTSTPRPLNMATALVEYLGHALGFSDRDVNVID